MNKGNNDLVAQFLDYLAKVRQNDPLSVELRRCHLRRLLFWANEIPFERADEITPSFPAYLAGSTGERTGKPLSRRFMRDTCVSARHFFTWLKRDQDSRFASLTADWIECLRPDKANGVNSELKKCEYYSLEDIRAILAVKPERLTDERGQAAAVFMFLSGMRIKAFLSLPISCVDLENFKVYQLPSKGVATKFHKAAITTFLRIPDLLEVARAWDIQVRGIFPPDQTWFAPIHQQRAHTGYFDPTAGTATHFRDKEFRIELKRLCGRAGIPFKSSHKLRHGHAIYGIKHAKDIKELKAVSQNLMHESLSVTDGVYGNLTADDVNSTIANLGTAPVQVAGDMGILLQALVKLQNNPALLEQILAS